LLQKLAGRFIRDEAGATAIEYGLIAALVSITIITAASAIGGGVKSTFETVQTSVQ
jgi:pilus assembly protein Flp/PilA